MTRVFKDVYCCTVSLSGEIKNLLSRFMNRFPMPVMQARRRQQSDPAVVVFFVVPTLGSPPTDSSEEAFI